MSKLSVYAKAIIAALIAGLGSVQVANADGKITMSEWIQVASVTLAALGFVWGVPNASPVVPVTPVPVAGPMPVPTGMPVPPA